jgi:hypothetical protein
MVKQVRAVGGSPFSKNPASSSRSLPVRRKKGTDFGFLHGKLKA